MDFNFKADAQVAMSIGGSGVDRGIHKAKIADTFLTKTKAGNNVLDIFFETPEGGKFGVYGICVDEKWASGAENYDYATFMDLALSAGMQSGETYDKVKKIGDEDVKAKGFKELEGKFVNVAVYWEFDIKDGKEKKTRKIQRVFNADGLSVAEVQAGKTKGTAMAKLDDRLADYYTKAWKQNGGGNANGADTQAPVDTSSQPASNEPEEDLI